MSEDQKHPGTSPSGEHGVSASEQGARATKSLVGPDADAAGSAAVTKQLPSSVPGAPGGGASAGAGTEDADASAIQHAGATASRVTASSEQDAMSAAKAAKDGRVVDASMDAAAAVHPIGKAVRESREQAKYVSHTMDASAEKATHAIIGDFSEKDKNQTSDAPESGKSKDSGLGAGKTTKQPKNAEHSSRSVGKVGQGSQKNDEDPNALKDMALGAGAGVGGAAGAQALTLFTFMQWLKSLFMALVAFVRNLITMILQTVMAVVAAVKGAVVGVGAYLASVSAGFISTTVASVMVATVGLAAPLVATAVTMINSAQEAQRNDVLGMCRDELDGSIQAAADAGVDTAGDSATTEENAKAIYGILAAAGAKSETIAGVLGNFDEESGIDPTSVETIFDEPQKIGPKKKAAEKAGFAISSINSSYAARFPAIKQAGIGFGQWTNGRNTALVDYAKKVGKPWHDPEVQMGYMLTVDSSASTFKKFIKEDHASPSEASQAFQSEWEGNPGSATAARAAAAQKWFSKMGGWKANKADLDSLLKQSGGSLDDSSGGDDPIKEAANNGLDQALANCRSGADTVSYGGSLGPDASGDAGPIPAGSWGKSFRWDQVPDNLKKYAVNPESVGLKKNDCTNWRPFIGDGGLYLNGQCVALSKALFGKFWQKDGHSPKGFSCNGDQCAAAAASANGGNYSNKPKAGAVVSVDTGTVNGHTFVVSHVFANGDIMLIEQNTPDSGASNSRGAEECSWNYRLFTKAGYESQNARFYTPPGYSVNPDLKTLGS